jgi:hypothetical protein
MASTRLILAPRNQKLTLSLPSGDYVVTLRWYAAVEAGWVMDIANATGVPLVSALPLVTGADLLAQHRHLGIGARLVVASDKRVDDVPAFAELGVSSWLFVITDE